MRGVGKVGGGYARGGWKVFWRMDGVVACGIVLLRIFSVDAVMYQFFRVVSNVLSVHRWTRLANFLGHCGFFLGAGVAQKYM